MRNRLLSGPTLGLLVGIVTVSAQPGPITTSNNSNLVIAASTLLTNGLPGLIGPPVTLMVAAVQSGSAQGGAVSLLGGQQWARRYNGPANNEDQAMAITADQDGNVIVGGYSLGTGSGQDFLTIKYSPDGVGLWTNRYNGPGNGGDQIRAVAVDGSGGVYVTGDSEGITTIKYAAGGTPVWTNTYSSSAPFLFFTGLAVDNAGNAYVAIVDADSDAYGAIKYDVNGNPAWTNLFNYSPSSQDSATGIAVDSAGNVFITGSSFDNGSGCWTVKCASNGSVLWGNRYFITGAGGTGGSGTQVMLDHQDNVLVAVDMHSIYGNYYAVVKYSNSGTALWTNVVSAVNYGGGGLPQITVDPVGNVVLVGGTLGAVSTAEDLTIVKYSSAGAPLWTNRFVDPNSGTQEFDGVGTDNAGNVYCVIASGSPNGSANYNYVTVKYSANGAAVWTNRYNGPGNASDLTRGMTVDRAGGVYVTGTSSSGGTTFGALDWATIKYSDNLRYVPPPNFVGQDTITFTAFDRFGNSAQGTVELDVVAGPLVTTVVAPDDYTTVPGNSGLNTLVRNSSLARTYQMQFAPEAMGGLSPGARITELRFRLSTNAAVSFPIATVTWADYEVTLAQAANSVGSMSTTFSANLLNPVLVRDGPLSVAPDNFGVGGSPNSFGAFLVLDTPYVYQGGDLVMQFTHTGSDSTNFAFLDAVTAAAPGYGSSFRAISANSFAALSGAAASATVVEIIATTPITQAINRVGNQVIISGTGGIAGTTYRILTSTNVASPVAQWTPVVTNQFGLGGSFGYTNVLQPNVPTRYFRVSVP